MRVGTGSNDRPKARKVDKRNRERQKTGVFRTAEFNASKLFALGGICLQSNDRDTQCSACNTSKWSFSSSMEMWILKGHTHELVGYSMPRRTAESD